MNAVTCAKWLKSGILASKPKKPATSAKSMQSLAVRRNKTNDKDDINKIINYYDLEGYSSDDDTSLQNMTTFLENKNDPYMKQSLLENDNSSSEDENIDRSDGVIVVGKTHRDYHSLEVWVVNKDEDSHINSYCHHDYILTSCPLDLECFSNANVNLAAVGMLTPIIQLWDLDEMNVVDPLIALGDSNEEGHTDAVLTLSHKFLSQNSSLLLSGSADGTVALWSVKEGEGRCVQKSRLGHSDKIQAVQWHPAEDSIFAVGSFDQRVCVHDCRVCFNNKKMADCTWSVNGEVEKILWDIHRPFNLYATTSTGFVHYFDIRMDKPLWDLSAHSPASASGIAQCGVDNGCLVTASDEGKAKIWDTRKRPAELVSSKSYKIGSIFCTATSPEDPMLFCVGGEREMKIVDLKKDTKINDYFSRASNSGSNVHKGNDVVDVGSGLSNNDEGVSAEKSESSLRTELLNNGEPCTRNKLLKKKRKTTENKSSIYHAESITTLDTNTINESSSRTELSNEYGLSINRKSLKKKHKTTENESSRYYLETTLDTNTIKNNSPSKNEQSNEGTSNILGMHRKRLKKKRKIAIGDDCSRNYVESIATLSTNAIMDKDEDGKAGSNCNNDADIKSTKNKHKKNIVKMEGLLNDIDSACKNNKKKDKRKAK